jgi:RNA polymerase sigma factor (sigma-70 family)
MTGSIEALVQRAKEGSRDALDAVIESIRDRVYALSLRMLGEPADAQDATQEILIKVLTRLDTFRGESRFTTWVHQVATNHLITARARRSEQVPMSFEVLSTLIAGGLAAATEDHGGESVTAVLAEEVRVTCTQAMLACLDRDERIAFVLGEILDFGGDEAAEILSITPEAFRKRLSRARAGILGFMKGRCGVYDAANPCRCSIQVPYARRTGMLDPNRLRFAKAPPTNDPTVTAALEEVVGLLDLGAIYRAQTLSPPDTLGDAIRAALDKKSD